MSLRSASIQIFLASPDHTIGMGGGGNSNAWPMLLDLGRTMSDFNQAMISADGKYLLVNLQTKSLLPDYPTQTLVTVDLVAKRIVASVKIGNNKAITILTPVPC